MDRQLDPSHVRRRRARSAALVVGGVAVAALFWFWLPRVLRPSVHRSSIRTAAVERGTVEALLQASGTVLPAFEQVVASPVEARVVRILRRPGDSVHRGDALVELDVSSIRLELGRAEEQLARKRSELRQAELDRDRQIDDLEGRRESQGLDAELYRYRLEQQRQLHADGLTSEEALRQAEVELRKAEVELRQLSSAITNLRDSSSERHAALRLEIGVLEQERAAAARRLELAETRSDRDGVLTWVVSEVGATVRPGDVLARVADLASYRIEATVADAYASRVSAGMPVRVRADDGVLGGSVTVVHPTVEDGAARFDVALDEPSHAALRPNRLVDVFVVTDVRPGVLRVSKGPFARAGRPQHVFVVRGDRAVRVEAEIGVGGQEHFEIVRGLAEGDVVILSDMTRYEHLQSVRVR